MAVIYSGTLDGLGGYKGLSFQYAKDATIGDAVTFAQPFLETPAIFVSGSSDEFVYADTPATTGFTPSQASASSSGSGTTANWLAIGRGDKQPGYRLFSSQIGELNIGDGTAGSGVTFPRGPFNETPAIICTPDSDLGVHIASEATTGFTPTACTGDGGAGTSVKYLAVGSGYNQTILRETSTSSNQAAGNWIEIGTYAALSAVTFAYPFASTPDIICSATSDGQHYAKSAATTGFTPTTITLTGKGAGASGVYMAIGPKRL